jgi:hypothetical protein
VFLTVNSARPPRRRPLFCATLHRVGARQPAASLAPPPLAAPQDAFDALFRELEDYIADHKPAPVAASVADAVAAFTKSKNLTPRQIVGLASRIDATWTQEYGAE